MPNLSTIAAFGIKSYSWSIIKWKEDKKKEGKEERTREREKGRKKDTE